MLCFHSRVAASFSCGKEAHRGQKGFKQVLHVNKHKTRRAFLFRKADLQSASEILIRIYVRRLWHVLFSKIIVKSGPQEALQTLNPISPRFISKCLGDWLGVCRWGLIGSNGALRGPAGILEMIYYLTVFSVCAQVAGHSLAQMSLTTKLPEFDPRKNYRTGSGKQ